MSTQPANLSRRQARTYHGLAISCRVIPLCRDVMETAQDQVQSADEHETDLEVLAEELEEASTELESMARLARQLSAD